MRASEPCSTTPTVRPDPSSSSSSHAAVSIDAGWMRPGQPSPAIGRIDSASTWVAGTISRAAIRARTAASVHSVPETMTSAGKT